MCDRKFIKNHKLETTMKRILNFSLIGLLAIVLLASCSKRDYYDNRSYTEDAYVEYDENTPYSIVSFDDGGFAVFKTLSSNPDDWPLEGEFVRGNFQTLGSRSFKNVTAGYTFNGRVVEFNNTYNEAKSALDYYATNDGYAIANRIKISASTRPRPIIK